MLKIGEFSRLSRVSVRMLRHYDGLGLLTPSQTDPLTGYRYYTADQLPRLNRILAFQDLGFSLEQIGGLLKEDLPAQELHGMLRLKRAEIEQDILAGQSRLMRLEARLRLLDGETPRPAYDVVVRSLSPQLVATRRQVVPDDEGIQYLFHQVETYVAQYPRARLDRPPLTIYHDAEYREQDIDAEVAVPLQAPIPGREPIRVCELPGIADAACVVHTGGYATLYQAYNALLAWIENNKRTIAGPIRETYLRYGADGLGFELPPTYLAASADSYVTELQLPVQEI